MTTDVVSDLTLVAVCAGYALAAWLVQMYRVVPPRDWLLQRTRSIRVRLGPSDPSAPDERRSNLDWLDSRVGRPWIVVPTSRVQAGWRHVHGLEDELVLSLPADEVDARLRTTATRLGTMGGDQAAAFVARIGEALDAPANLGERRALLREVEVFRHNVSDGNYEDLASLLAKAVWLAVVALALVAALGSLFDRETYFLLGAAGGLISRLSRVLRRRPDAGDYGASWSTMLLAPAAGALMGWLAVLLVNVLTNPPFNLFDDRFAAPWANAYHGLGLLLAFAFGFSERLFERLLGVTVKKAGGTFDEEEDQPKK